jgi:hypothetical protein
MAFGADLRVENDLRNASAVAQFEEDEIAVVAAAVDPAHQDHLLAGVGGSQIAAHVGAFQIA